MKADGWLYLCAAHPVTKSVRRTGIVCHIVLSPIETKFFVSKTLIVIVPCHRLYCSYFGWSHHAPKQLKVLSKQVRFGVCGFSRWRKCFGLSEQILSFRISIPEPSLKHLQAIARRLYRIFAHAYFHHREAFEFFEVSQSQLLAYGRV
jgi:hypothetical protein